MADTSFNQQLVDRLAELTKLVLEHQAHLFTFHAYLREQPSFDPVRYGKIFAEQRELLNLPKAELGREQLDAALLAILRDFEGPIQ